MDWSGYRLIFLPNVALMSEETQTRIEGTLDRDLHTRLVAKGSFGLYSADGQTSYGPLHHALRLRHLAVEVPPWELVVVYCE